MCLLIDRSSSDATEEVKEAQSSTRHHCEAMSHPWQSSKENYYAVLEITTQSIHEVQPIEVKKAYRKMALVFHPDKGHKGGELLFQRIQEAYEVLNDTLKQREYNEWFSSHFKTSAVAYGALEREAKKRKQVVDDILGAEEKERLEQEKAERVREEDERREAEDAHRKREANQRRRQRKRAAAEARRQEAEWAKKVEEKRRREWDVLERRRQEERAKAEERHKKLEEEERQQEAQKEAQREAQKQQAGKQEAKQQEDKEEYAQQQNTREKQAGSQDSERPNSRDSTKPIPQNLSKKDYFERLSNLENKSVSLADERDKLTEESERLAKRADLIRSSAEAAFAKAKKKYDESLKRSKAQLEKALLFDRQSDNLHISVLDVLDEYNDLTDMYESKYGVPVDDDPSNASHDDSYVNGNDDQHEPTDHGEFEDSIPSSFDSPTRPISAHEYVRKHGSPLGTPTSKETRSTSSDTGLNKSGGSTPKSSPSKSQPQPQPQPQSHPKAQQQPAQPQPAQVPPLDANVSSNPFASPGTKTTRTVKPLQSSNTSDSNSSPHKESSTGSVNHGTIPSSPSEPGFGPLNFEGSNSSAASNGNATSKPFFVPHTFAGPNSDAYVFSPRQKFKFSSATE